MIVGFRKLGVASGTIVGLLQANQYTLATVLACVYIVTNTVQHLVGRGEEQSDG